jgi:hypothetical protein
LRMTLSSFSLPLTLRMESLCSSCTEGGEGGGGGKEA